jgi:hypothetical protein
MPHSRLREETTGFSSLRKCCAPHGNEPFRDGVTDLDGNWVEPYRLQGAAGMAAMAAERGTVVTPKLEQI